MPSVGEDDRDTEDAVELGHAVNHRPTVGQAFVLRQSAATSASRVARHQHGAGEHQIPRCSSSSGSFTASGSTFVVERRDQDDQAATGTMICQMGTRWVPRNQRATRRGAPDRRRQDQGPITPDHARRPNTSWVKKMRQAATISAATSVTTASARTGDPVSLRTLPNAVVPRPSRLRV